MKYIKTFEDINNCKPEVNKYAIAEYKDILVIGKIYAESGSIRSNISREGEQKFYYIKFKLPDGRTYNDIFYANNIKYCAKTKKELEFILTAQKYNI